MGRASSDSEHLGPGGSVPVLFGLRAATALIGLVGLWRAVSRAPGPSGALGVLAAVAVGLVLLLLGAVTVGGLSARGRMWTGRLRRAMGRPWRRPRRGYLVPAELASVPATFIGRDAERDEIRERLCAARADGPPVVVVRGPDGIGKTALAVVVATELAGDYAGGRLFADLGRWRGTVARDRADVVRDALAALITGLKKPTQAVAPEPDRERQYRELTDRYRSIIVLDDADDPEVVCRLLPRSPRCAVIVTTSATGWAGRPGWHYLDLKPLPERHVMRLLRAIVPADWVADDDTCRRIAHAMRGHPNATRLTATQLATRAASHIGALEQIYDDPAAQLSAVRWREHARGRGGGTAQASINSALQLSYRLLGEEEQHALRLIGGVLTQPTFALWTLSGLLDGDDSRAQRVTDRLVLAGFLTRDSSDAAGVPVFQVADDVRAFAEARFFDESRPPDLGVLNARIGARSDERQGTDVQTATALALARLAAGDLGHALHVGRWAVELARDVGDPGQERLALGTLAEIRAELGAFGSASDLAAAALAGPADPVARLRAGRCRARLARRAGDDEAARATLEDLVATVDAVDPEAATELVLVLRDLAIAEARTGGGATAGVPGQASIEQAIRRCATLPDGGSSVRAGLCWAQSVVWERVGAWEDATACLVRGEQAALRRAQRLWLAWLGHRHATLLLRRGDHDAAALRQAGDALRAFSAMNHRFGRAHAGRVLGEIHAGRADRSSGAAAQTDRHRARLRWQQARDDFTDAGDLGAAAELAERLAELPGAVPASAATGLAEVR